MSIISIPFTFSAGAVIIASQHNTNFSTIYSDYNGNIDNNNIVASAGIVYSKLSLSGGIINADINNSAAIAYSKLNLGTSIVNADISASAAIVDTKLAQITTASKISGTSITNLASLPSGAGVIPSANLPSGGISLVSATNVSAAIVSSSINITSGQTYFIQFNVQNLSSSDTIAVRFNGDTGSTYSYVNVINNTTGAATKLSATATSAIISGSAATIGASASTGYEGGFYIRQNGTSSQIYSIWGQGVYIDNSGLLTNNNFSGKWGNSVNVTSFTMLTIGGSTFDGNIYLYKLSLS